MKSLIPSPESKQQALLQELEIERGIWLPLKQRTERSGGFDASLKLEYQMSSRVMDSLLDQYFAANVIVELGNEAVV